MVDGPQLRIDIKPCDMFFKFPLARRVLQVSLDYQGSKSPSLSTDFTSSHTHPIDNDDKRRTRRRRPPASTPRHACLLLTRALRDQGPGRVGGAVAQLRRPVCDAAAWLRREFEAELAASEKENCQSFFERVPAADALPEESTLTHSAMEMVNLL
ncbi:hypothetical protein EJB05_23917, partial [Eragrostis curvula]